MANTWRYVAEIYDVLDGEIRGDRLEGKYVLTVDEAKLFAVDYAENVGKRIWLGVLEPGRGYCFAMHVEPSPPVSEWLPCQTCINSHRRIK